MVLGAGFAYGSRLEVLFQVHALNREPRTQNRERTLNQEP